MTDTEKNTSPLKLALTAAVLLLLLAILMVVNSEAASTSLDRKIKIMERVVDEILVQSQHAVVHSENATRGLFLEGYGALFVIDVDLDVSEYLGAVRGTIMHFDEGRLRIRERNRTDDAGGEEEVSWEEWQKQEEARQKKAAAQRQKNLDALQLELSGALVDYGATLSELSANDHVTFVVFFDGGLLPQPRLLGSSETENHQQLTISATMGELRQLAAGQQSREQALRQLEIARD